MSHPDVPQRRAGDRGYGDLRAVSFEPRFTSSPDGSVHVKQGATWAPSTVSATDWLPQWRRESGQGRWALVQAERRLRSMGVLHADPVVSQIAAVGAGIVDATPLLDVDYSEDVRAQAGLNTVMTADGRFVEVQGTAEGPPFAGAELDRHLDSAAQGIEVLGLAQREALDGS